ncbi:hypothetical protein Tco_0574327 [Tanacetum coccineum]
MGGRQKWSSEDQRDILILGWADFRILLVSNSYVDREEISFKPRYDFQDAEEEIREVKDMFERIISKGRSLEDFIQKKLDDLKDNHKFRGGLLGINLHKT